MLSRQGIGLEVATASGTDIRQLDAVACPNPDFTGAPAADIAAGTQRLTVLGTLMASGFGLTTSTPDARLRFVLRQEGMGQAQRP